MERQMFLKMGGFSPDNPRGFTDGQPVRQATVYGQIGFYESAPGTFRIIDGQPFIESCGVLIRDPSKWHGTRRDAALAAAEELEARGRELIARADTIRAKGSL